MRRLSSVNLESERKKTKREIEMRNFSILYCVNKYIKNISRKSPIYHINDIHSYRNDLIRRFSYQYSFDFYFDWKFYFNLEESILEGTIFRFQFIENIQSNILSLRNMERIYYSGEHVNINSIYYKNTSMENIFPVKTENSTCDNIKNFKFTPYLFSVKFLSLKNNSLEREYALSYIRDHIECEIFETDYHYYYRNNILIAENIFVDFPYKDLKYLKIKKNEGGEYYDLIDKNRYIEYLSLDSININKNRILAVGKLQYLKYLGLQNNTIDIFTSLIILKQVKSTLRYLNLSNIILPYDFLQSLKKILRNCKVLYNENKEIHIK